MTKDKDLSNVIPFPKNRIVEKKTTGPKKDQKFLDELHRQQTKEFVETSVDEISLNLLKRLYDLAIKTNKKAFTKDLAMLVDVLRGMIYRDFGSKLPGPSFNSSFISLLIGTVLPLLNIS